VQLSPLGVLTGYAALLITVTLLVVYLYRAREDARKSNDTIGIIVGGLYGLAAEARNSPRQPSYLICLTHAMEVAGATDELIAKTIQELERR